MPLPPLAIHLGKMGRRKIEIQPITDERNRTITFVKRKAGLFKKAHELAILCQVDIAVIIYNNSNNNFYEFSLCDMEKVLEAYKNTDKIYESKNPSNFGGEDPKHARYLSNATSMLNPDLVAEESDDDRKHKRQISEAVGPQKYGVAGPGPGNAGISGNMHKRAKSQNYVDTNFQDPYLRPQQYANLFTLPQNYQKMPFVALKLSQFEDANGNSYDGKLLLLAPNFVFPPPNLSQKLPLFPFEKAQTNPAPPIPYTQHVPKQPSNLRPVLRVTIPEGEKEPEKLPKLAAASARVPLPTGHPTSGLVSLSIRPLLFNTGNGEQTPVSGFPMGRMADTKYMNEFFPLPLNYYGEWNLNSAGNTPVRTQLPPLRNKEEDRKVKDEET